MIEWALVTILFGADFGALSTETWKDRNDCEQVKYLVLALARDNGDTQVAAYCVARVTTTKQTA